MFYVFLVDTGTMLKFDMSIALESVSYLKEAIAKLSKIPPEKQVLLISGGESLSLTDKVCNYSTGTDTNPIFLFSKTTIESAIPPSPSIEYGSANDMKELVDACLALKDTTYNTVVERAKIAQQLYDSAQQQTSVCELLVHDQHLQQQGWAAVIANLEDTVMGFKEKAEIFERSYSQYLDRRPENMTLLSTFEDDIEILSQIPVLPKLLSQASNPNDTKPISLLDWVSSADQQSSIQVLAATCAEGLEQMDENLLDDVQKEIQGALTMAHDARMKEIRGLEDRLSGLELLLHEARKKVQEQAELAQSFQQNQTRARHLGDPSVLPDLCMSHRQQLKVMLKNEEKLRDIRTRCTRAKEELSGNLHARLRWIVHVQKHLADVTGMLVMRHERFRRLKKLLEIVRQIHQAPRLYVQTVWEVVRRRNFAEAFIQWASLLSEQAFSVHQEEIVGRKNYRDQVEGHFLQSLFPGLDDLPPPFATQCPSLFDTQLPQLTNDDAELLMFKLNSVWSSLGLSLEREDFKEPQILRDWAQSLLQLKDKKSKSEQIGVDVNVLPSLSAALLSPPMKNMKYKRHRSFSSLANPDKVPRPVLSSSLLPSLSLSPKSEYTTTDFFIDDSDMGPSYPEDLGESHKIFEKNQRIAALEDELQRMIGKLREAELKSSTVKSVLPRLKSEIKEIRQLWESWRGNLNYEELRAKVTLMGTEVYQTFLEQASRTSGLIADLREKNESLAKFVKGLEEQKSQDLKSWENKIQNLAQERDNAVIAADQLRDANERLEEEISRWEQSMEEFGHEKAAWEREKEEYLEKRRVEEEEWEREKEKHALELELELDRAKEELKKRDVDFETQINLLQQANDNLQQEVEELHQVAKTTAVKHEEYVAQLVASHQQEKEAEMSRLRAQLELEKNEAVAALKQNLMLEQAMEVEQLEIKLKGENILEQEKLQEELAAQNRKQLQSELTVRLQSAQVEWEKAWEERWRSREEALHEEREAEIARLREELSKAHKLEMEGLRSRFRMMTSLGDKSPSDSSLEKFDRPTPPASPRPRKDTPTSPPKHHDILGSWPGARVAEREHGKPPLDRLRLWEDRFVQEKEHVKKLLDEEREKIMKTNPKKLSDELQRKVWANEALSHALTEHNTVLAELQHRVAALEDENKRLKEGETERNPLMRSYSHGACIMPMHMTASVAVLPSGPAEHPPLNNMKELSKSAKTLIRQGSVNIRGCEVGDTVFVQWDAQYNTYGVLQKGPHLHFVHADSFPILQATPPKLDLGTGAPEPILARVTQREFCLVRKDENRYRLPKGTNFYRVKVELLNAPAAPQDSSATAPAK